MTVRTEDGKFPKGVSGNPKGRPTKEEQARKSVPNKTLRRVLKLCQGYSAEAVEEMYSLMKDSKTPATVKLAAAKAILDKTESLYNALEAPAKEKVDDEENEELALAPVVDFGSIVKTKSE